MSLEYAGQREFAQFVTDHILRDVHGDESLAIVNAERVSDEIGRDRRAAGPGLNGFLRATGLDGLLVGFPDLVEDVADLVRPGVVEKLLAQ